VTLWLAAYVQAAAPQQSDFLRLIDKGSTGSRLETADVAYRNADGVTVHLVSAVHVGEHDYFTGLNESFKLHDAVLYEMVKPKDALVPAPGVAPVEGLAGAEGSLGHLLTLGVEFDFLDATSVERGDVAFVSAAWTERGVGPDGPYEFQTRTSDMLRRQADGTWKFLVNTLARDVRQ